MSVSLLDLYNKVASQPWSMFDNDTQSTDDFDPALISSINKALVELWCSYPFDFRLKEKNIITQKNINKYNLPDGTILQKNTSKGERYSVILGNKYLDFIENPDELELLSGKPEGFFVKNDVICFYPIPDKIYSVKILYHSFSIGEDINGMPIYALVEDTDKIIIPDKYKQLFLNALISKIMMYSIASPADENYVGYNIQFEKAYNLLLKAVGGRKRNRKIVF